MEALRIAEIAGMSRHGVVRVEEHAPPPSCPPNSPPRYTRTSIISRSHSAHRPVFTHDETLQLSTVGSQKVKRETAETPRHIVARAQTRKIKKWDTYSLNISFVFTPIVLQCVLVFRESLDRGGYASKDVALQRMVLSRTQGIDNTPSTTSRLEWSS